MTPPNRARRHQACIPSLSGPEVQDPPGGGCDPSGGSRRPQAVSLSPQARPASSHSFSPCLLPSLAVTRTPAHQVRPIISSPESSLNLVSKDPPRTTATLPGMGCGHIFWGDDFQPGHSAHFLEVASGPVGQFSPTDTCRSPMRGTRPHAPNPLWPSAWWVCRQARRGWAFVTRT